MSMAAFLMIGNRRVKLRFFIFLALPLIILFYLFLSNKPSAAYTALSYGRLDVSHNGLAVIIRQESVYTAPAYGKAVYLVANGSTVSEGQSIAVLYKESFNEEIVKQLYDVQEKIIKYQQEQLMDQVINSDIINIDASIEALVSDIQSSVKDNEFNELGKLDSRLRKLLDNKQKLLDYQTQPDSYLTRLYDKEASLVAQMEEWTIKVESPKSGLISFSVDGLENVLGLDSVDKLTSIDLEHILQHADPEVQTVELLNDSAGKQQAAAVQAEQPFFRIADPAEEWYAVLKCDSTETYLDKGDTVEAVFEGQDEISAVVTQIHKDKDQVILIIKFSSDMDKLVSKRVHPLQVKKTVQGLMVPAKALYMKKGVSGIYVRDRDENIFIETSIQALSDGFAIVESVSDNQVLQLHDQVLIDNE
jgi:hypothetical protein